MKQKALVIGPTSMLGQRVMQRLSADGVEVFTAGRARDCNVPVDLDRNEPVHIPRGLQVDMVFHCAASFADDSWDGCRRNELVNAFSSYSVAEMAVELGCSSFIYAGSIMSNTLVTAPGISSYGASKSRAEDILEWALQKRNIPFASLRFAQLYDENGECCRHQLWFGRTIAYASAGRVLRMPGGEAKRNFLHVENAATLMVSSGMACLQGRHTVCHPDSLSNQDIAAIAYEVFGRGGGVEIASEKQPFREIDISASSQLVASLDCSPTLSMREGIELIRDHGKPERFGPMDVQ